MDKDNRYDFRVPSLGVARVPSPVRYSNDYGDCIANYVSDDSNIILQVDLTFESIDSIDIKDLGLLERAGPRERIYFNPHHVHAGIVTCGGLCPGINDVIRALVHCLWYRYGTKRITGIRYGYHGLLPESNFDPITLNPQVVNEIHRVGGSFLGNSRGAGERTAEIVDSIEQLNLNMLFIIGGDGTQRGAIRIVKEIEKRNLKIAVIGVPKTIDNDLSFIQRSFGFETAVAKATEAVWSATAEASSAENGIGLVKVMGRQSGFIAAHTAIASHAVDVALVPEVPFDLDGAQGLFTVLHNTLKEQGKATIVVAEGAGQELLAGDGNNTKDASGNEALADIGRFLQQQITAHFKQAASPINLKYINPSYIVRSAVATPSDSLYCSRLATNAVHAAMAGKTNILVSLINNHFIHLPTQLAVAKRNTIDPEGSLWRDVIESTSQPLRMNNEGSSCAIGGKVRNPSKGVTITSAGSNS